MSPRRCRVWRATAVVRGHAGGDFAPGASKLNRIRMKDDPEALLGGHVDVVSSGGLNELDEQIGALPYPGRRSCWSARVTGSQCCPPPRDWTGMPGWSSLHSSITS